MTIRFPLEFKDIPILFRIYKSDSKLVLEVYDRDISPDWIYTAVMPVDELQEIDATPEEVSRVYSGAGYADFEAFMTTGEIPPKPEVRE